MGYTVFLFLETVNTVSLLVAVKDKPEVIASMLNDSKSHFQAEYYTSMNFFHPLMHRLRISRLNGMAKAVLIKSNATEPESGNYGIQIRKNLFLLVCKRSFPMIPTQKCGKDYAFLLSVDFFWVIHKPRFKNRLHDCIVVENIITASIEIKYADLAVRSLIQITVADISLNSISRFISKDTNLLKKSVIFLHNIFVKRFIHRYHKIFLLLKILKAEKIVFTQRIK